jgi:hypothetical protein
MQGERHVALGGALQRTNEVAGVHVLYVSIWTKAEKGRRGGKRRVHDEGAVDGCVAPQGLNEHAGLDMLKIKGLRLSGTGRGRGGSGRVTGGCVGVCITLLRFFDGCISTMAVGGRLKKGQKSVHDVAFGGEKGCKRPRR